MTNSTLLTLELRLEHDVVLARQRARQIAALLGFDTQDQTRIATAVSEMARNAYKYAGGGREPNHDLPVSDRDDYEAIFLAIDRQLGWRG